MYEFVRFYVCSFELQFLMPYEDSDNPNSIFYVFGVYYIYIYIDSICKSFIRPLEILQSNFIWRMNKNEPPLN